MENTNNTQKQSHRGRIMSIDALRGFDMFWIIGGDLIVKALAVATGWTFLNKLVIQFEHVPWEGFRFEDLIMPLFLFIVGVVMPFSFNRRIAGGKTKKQIYLHVIKRVIILWILGMIAQGNLLDYDPSKLQLYSNTLQAIAAGYLIASIFILHLNLRWQMVGTAALLLVFWAMMTFVPVPEYGPGVLTEDGNMAIYIDNIVLGKFSDGYSYTWVLSSLTFGATVMLGVMAGHILKSNKTEVAKFFWLLSAGIGALAIGWIWGIWSPIIKHIWTSSFTIFSAGLCLLLLAVFYLIIDVLKLRKWAFGFVVIGMNPIFIYMAVHVFDFKHIGNIFVGGLLERLGNWSDFTQQIAAFTAIWLILYCMYRKKIFIKI
jgi:predicted acyltransferase